MRSLYILPTGNKSHEKTRTSNFPTLSVELAASLLAPTEDRKRVTNNFIYIYVYKGRVMS